MYSSNWTDSNEIYDEMSMTDVRINDVNMRIGYPYLLRHIENCDHMIMLTDIRLSDNYDNLIQNVKTMVTYQRKLKRTICDACSFYYARFISINDKFSGENSKVIFLCDECLKSLHKRSFQSEIIKNVKLIPYYHD